MPWPESGNSMLKIKEAVIVEGRYDKNTLLQAVNCTVIETSGFGIFKNSEKAALLRRLAATRGIIVFTDSDSAGFLIRNHIKGTIGGNVKHAYIPDIPGKERRKSSPSKEGKLGVEGMRPEVIIEALRRAGATFIGSAPECEREQGISKADFFSLGLTGAPDSGKRRAALLKELSLPSKMTTNSLLDVANALYTREEFLDIISSLLPQ